MKKFYFLSTCNTCQRILNHLDLNEEFELQDIKKISITSKELVLLKSLTGSYESLFNKRAKLYKELGLKEKDLSWGLFYHINNFLGIYFLYLNLYCRYL